MVKAFTFIRRNLVSFSLFLGPVFMFLAFNQYQLHSRVGQANAIRDGLQTCFYRSYQSFVAHLLSLSQSDYLSANFKDKTEACYGDVIEEVRAELGENLKNILNPLNELARENHWFHKKIEGDQSALLKNGEVGSRFEDIEKNKDKSLAALKQFEKENNDKAAWFRDTFLMISLGLFFSLLLNALRERRIRSLLRYVNHEAKAISEDKLFPQEESIQKLFQHFSQEFQVPAVGELVEKYAYWSKEQLLKKQKELEKAPAKSKIKIKNIEKPTQDGSLLIDQKAAQGQANEVALPKPIKKRPPEPPKTSVEKILSVALSRLSLEFLKHGIHCDVVVRQDFALNSNEEYLMQLLYSLAQTSLDSAKQYSQSPEIIITLKKSHSKGYVQFDFSSEINEEETQGPNLDICHYLAQELGAQLTWSDAIDRLGQKKGAQLNLSFPLSDQKMAEGAQKQIKKILRGTKKEISQQIKKSQLNS